MAVQAVIFDLGGVLAEFGGVAPMRALAGIESDDELWRRWLTCEWVRSFERGGCSPADFASGVVADWGLNISADAFLRDFVGWLVGPFEGAHELVEEVRAQVPVACLSNTNSLHWEAGAARWPLLSLFNHTFLSFEVGMVKPDREIFEHVVEQLGGPPDRLLFLDDNAVNVEQAAAVGMRSIRVQGVQQARRTLVDAGVLTPSYTN